MNAWIVPREGTLALTSLPLAPLRPEQIRVRVHYSGVGFADVMAAAGGYPLAPKAPFSPGYEFTGEVVEVGAGVTSPVVGITVVGMLPRMGAYREFIDVDPVWVLPLPPGLEETKAALLPLNYLTAEALLGLKTKLSAGQSLVIHGAAGGVGLAVLERARARRLMVYGSAKPSKFGPIEALGAVPLDSSDWVSPLRNHEPRGVDAAFDSFGGKSLELSWKALAPGGALVSYGFSPTAGGGWAPMIAGVLSIGMKKLVPGRSAQICGTPGLCKANPQWYRSTMEELLALAVHGEITPRLHAVLPWHQAPEAHAIITSRQSRGKLLLDWR